MTGTGDVKDSLRLVGPASLDRYLDESFDLPGGGALNMAAHWGGRGHPVELVTRISTRVRDVFQPFLTEHRVDIAPGVFVNGEPCSIDIRFAADRQPEMDNFVEGVLADLSLDEREVASLFDGTPTHFVLVDVIDAALHDAMVRRKTPSNAAPRWTGDFLSFRHMTPDRFSATMRHLELGIVGWPGDRDDSIVHDLADRAAEAESVLVVTFGAHGVLVVDGRDGARSDQWFEVTARPVAGTTIGCGDAFAAAFLSMWFTSGDVGQAIDAGRQLGAAATEWLRPLPDRAYGAALNRK